jgi:hypothetical protein
MVYWEDLMVELGGKTVTFYVITSVQKMFLNMKEVQQQDIIEIPPRSSIAAVCRLSRGVFFFVFI